MINWKEFHLQLQRDAFFGFPPLAEREPRAQPPQNRHSRTATLDTAASQTAPKDKVVDDDTVGKRPAERASLKQSDYEAPITTAHRLVSRIYADLGHIEQARQARDTFHGKFFSNDIHRELIYLWCSFLGLAAYRDGEPLDWTWRDFIEHWDADFEFNDDELRNFLRDQHLLLPAYFFYGDSDNTHNLEVAEIALHHLGIDGFHPEPTAGRQTQMDRTAQMRRAWQQQINQLAKQPEHRGKTHESLCKLVATDPVGQGKNPETIRRWTKKP